MSKQKPRHRLYLSTQQSGAVLLLYEREARAVLAEEKGRLAELESLLAQIGLPTSASATASCDSPTQPLR